MPSLFQTLMRKNYLQFKSVYSYRRSVFSSLSSPSVRDALDYEFSEGQTVLSESVRGEEILRGVEPRSLNTLRTRMLSGAVWDSAK